MIIMAAALFRIPILVVACVLIFSLATQIALFAVSVWAMRYRLVARQVLAFIPMLLAVPVVGLLSSTAETHFIAFSLMASAGLLVVGLFMVRFAYRSWLKTETG